MNIVTKTDASALTRMATAIRVLAMDAVEAANSGHPGAPMGMADIAAVLWGRIARVDPSRPDWPDRDRVILSAGHASMLLYGVHHLLGYEDMGVDQLRRFRQLGAGAAGHPEYGHAQGIEMTTGPLGQGIATSVGMALAERMANARHGDALVDHFTYVLCGDGCLMEGVSQEAADLAGHLGLGRLIVLWDDNGITIDGGTEMSTSIDQRARFAASGWHVQAIDGHDHDAIEAAIRAAHADPRPSLIACRTVIGFGAPNKQGGHAVHGAPLGAEEIAAARVALDWPHAPFEIPQEIRDDWLDAAARGRKAREAWEARLDNSPNGAALREDLTGPDRAALAEAIAAYKAGVSLHAPAMATRIASQKALEAVNGTVRQMIGGSADLTGSNNTKTAGMTPVTRDDYAGRYLHWGVREHGMACAMNGLALHGGFRPYGGGFLVFSDYCRPAIRLAALMQVPAVHVLTHDSIGLGEDGPTHQPVEHLAALRAIPGLLVFRPCDGVETAEAWEIAATESRPSALCLSRQSLPTLRIEHRPENLSSRGAYLLRDVPAPRHATLIATGSEVSIAMAAAHALAAEGLRIAVVSAPCFALFEEQPESYRDAVLGHAPRVGVEAALRRGWDGMLDRRDGFVGMTGFGASAPAHELYRHFGITPEAVADAVRARLTT